MGGSRVIPWVNNTLVASISSTNVLTEHLILAKHHLFSLGSLNLASVPITPLKQFSLMLIISSFLKKVPCSFCSYQGQSLFCAYWSGQARLCCRNKQPPNFSSSQQRFISFLHHMSAAHQLGLCSALSPFWDPSTLNGRCLAHCWCCGRGGQWALEGCTC